MSLIKLQGNASGTGAFTIAAPNGNTDRTLTLPDATGTVLAAPAGSVTISSSAPSNSLTLDGSGNLGLGVTPSAWDSAIFKSIDIGGVYKNSFYGQANGDWTAGVGTNHYYNSGWKYASTGAASRYEVKSNQHAWYNAPSGTAGNAITFTQAMTLDASGRLMIGTTSQDGSLTVANGSIEGPVASVTNSRNVSGDQVLVLKNGANANNTSSYYLVCQQPGVANRMFIFGNGNVVNLNNSYGALSDEKLKENIIDSGSQWDDLKAVRVRKYSLKADNADGPNQIGVIAQELEAAGMGGLVFESPDLDADKQPTGEVTKQVNYSILYMKAVKALQEAMARIETLEAKVNALEAN